MKTFGEPINCNDQEIRLVDVLKNLIIDGAGVAVYMSALLDLTCFLHVNFIVKPFSNLSFNFQFSLNST